MSQSEQKSSKDADAELFRLLVENVTDYAIILLDPQGHIVHWNPGAERIIGYGADEVIGHHGSLFCLEEDVPTGKEDQELRTATAGGRSEDEGWRVRKDGSRFWGNVVTTALRDESGVLKGFSKIIRDMTKRRRSEEQFRILVEAAPIGMVMVTEDGTICLANTHAVESFGYEPGELL